MAQLLAYLCPGQASQLVGMGSDLYEGSDTARRMYDRADEILGWSVSRLSFEGPQDALNQTKNTQPALFTLSVIASEILNERGLRPDVAVGHSLGEYGALVVGGALSFEDGLTAVAERGRLMSLATESSPGAMTAVIGLDDDKVVAICEQVSAEEEIVVAANFNSPGQIVISGASGAVKRAGAAMAEAGAKRVVPLPVSGAFHSPLMQSAADEYAGFLSEVEIGDTTIPVIANVTARPVSDAKEVRLLLVQQLVSPVKWGDSITYLSKMGVNHALEVGPGKVLQGLVRRIDRSISVSGAGTLADISAATDSQP